MGENKHINELDAFAKKYIKEIKQESPSIDFTNSLMNRIILEDKINVKQNKPIISKTGWFFILFLILVSLFFSLNSNEELLFNFPEFDFSFFDKYQISNILSSISISTITVYAFLFFGLMITFQFIYLNKYFKKNIG